MRIALHDASVWAMRTQLKVREESCNSVLIKKIEFGEPGHIRCVVARAFQRHFAKKFHSSFASFPKESACSAFGRIVLAYFFVGQISILHRKNVTLHRRQHDEARGNFTARL